jgi:hypothetical protein
MGAGQSLPIGWPALGWFVRRGQEQDRAASAAVPTSLISSTVKAAAMIAAGQATVARVVPAKVAILREGVLKAMVLSKLKTPTVGLLLVALLIGAAGAIYQTQAAERPKDGQRNKTVTDGPRLQKMLSSPLPKPPSESASSCRGCWKPVPTSQRWCVVY